MQELVWGVSFVTVSCDVIYYGDVSCDSTTVYKRTRLGLG